MRKLKVRDASFLGEVLCDADSMQYYDHHFTPEGVVNWIEKNQVRYETEGFGLYAVIRKRDGAFIGDCGVTMQNIDNELLPEVGFHIIKRFCRNGYASEAAKGCISYFFQQCTEKKIYSYTKKENFPSVGVMKKIGMKFLKEYRKVGQPVVVYCMKRSDWEDSGKTVCHPYQY